MSKKIKNWWDFFLSDVAKKYFIDPEKSLQFIENQSPNIIQMAYDIRKEDITFFEFQKKLQYLTIQE